MSVFASLVARSLLATLLAAIPASVVAQSAEPAPLQLVAKIPLGEVKGRIDHMTVDLVRERLFVAELANNSVGIVELKAPKASRTLRGLKEPQGVGYLSSIDTLYVANGGDGTVRLFRGRSLEESGRILLGDDADNVRINRAGSRIFVGYGNGALAIIDANSSRKLTDIVLSGHPESFRLESGESRIYVNVPDARAIEVVDPHEGEVIARWTMVQAADNFPMALDEALRRVLVVFRKPAILAAFSMQDGSQVASEETCGDADDVFVDARRDRVYVSCGDGFLDVFEPNGERYRRTAHLPTAPGARTSLFVPELNRLFLAVREGVANRAAIWVYVPLP